MHAFSHLPSCEPKSRNLVLWSTVKVQLLASPESFTVGAVAPLLLTTVLEPCLWGHAPTPILPLLVQLTDVLESVLVHHVC